MTEAGWTSEKPTEAGFYWYRELFGDKQMRVVELVQSKVEPDVLCEASGVLLCYFTGEWILCPITPDSYRQGRVAGLREAAEMVEDDCYIEGGELLPDYEHRCKHNVNQKELAGKIRFRANDLAQQAQEGGVGE